MSIRLLSIGLIGLTLVIASPSGATGGGIPVFVSVLPQAYFVERVGGEHVEVTVMVQPGQSPATYAPTPRQLGSLSEAKLYFSVGVPFERGFLHKVASTSPGLRIVDTREGVPLLTMAGERIPGGPRHDEGMGETEPSDSAHELGEHSHGGNDPDPHTWLDPKRVMIQAETIARALVEIDPAGEKGYRTNLASFQRELHILDRRIAEVFAPLEGARFMVYHPAYGYFADAYGLRQVAVETEGKEPSARQLTALIEAARASEVEIIFYQPQFSSKYATVVADAVGAVAVPLDPLARNYIRNLEEMADKIEQALDRKAH